MTELRTERVVLRPWLPGDREPFAALNADPAVMEHFPRPLTRDETDVVADRIERHFAEHGYGLWALEVAGQFAGFTGLSWVGFTAPFTPALEVGWRLARAYWGQGYATEAARAALAFGLSREPSVVSFTARCNERSWRLMERIGMRFEGEFRHPAEHVPERLQPHVLYRARPA